MSYKLLLSKKYKHFINLHQSDWKDHNLAGIDESILKLEIIENKNLNFIYTFKALNNQGRILTHSLLTKNYPGESNFYDNLLGDSLDYDRLGYDSLDHVVCTRLYSWNFFNKLDEHKNKIIKREDILFYNSFLSIAGYFSTNNISPKKSPENKLYVPGPNIPTDNKPSLREKYLIRRLAQGKITDEEYLEFLET